MREGSAPSIAKSIRGNSGGIDREDGTGRGTPIIPDVCGTLSDGAHNGGGLNGQGAYTGRIIPAITVHGTQDPDTIKECAHVLGRNNGQENAVMVMENQRGEFRTDDIEQPATLALRGRGGAPQLETRSDGTANTLLTPNGGRGGMGVGAIAKGMEVRRLTPVECERLQGFPDNYTRIPWRNKTPEQCPDGPRYKALGNSMAVPVMRWIGERIDAVQWELEISKGIEVLGDMNVGTAQQDTGGEK
jgi:DNA (cytosine-5)-methyltransferase 1